MTIEWKIAYFQKEDYIEMPPNWSDSQSKDYFQISLHLHKGHSTTTETYFHKIHA